MGNLVNTWRTTGDAGQVQPLNISNNLHYLTQVLATREQEIRVDTGIDPNAMFEAPAQQLGTVEIIEENKAIRLKALQISRDICLDNAITAAYHNIQQFAPVVLRKTEKVKV
jgi:hypothetical protein